MASFVELLREGLEHHRAGRLKQAEHSYRKVLETHPRHAGAVHLLGLIAFQAGKTELAIHHLQTAIKLDRFQSAFHADLGEIYRAKGLFADAIGMYRSALALNPEDASAQMRLGTLYQTTGEPDLAEQCFGEALSLRPKYAEAERHLGEVHLGRGKLDEARQALERSVQCDGNSAESYQALGDCFYEMGRSLDAIACYQKAVHLQADLAPAHHHMALARLAEADFENGWRDLEWRHQCPEWTIADSRPRWRGGSLDGQRVLVHGEGTLGDVLQFARYVPVLTRRGGEVLFEVPEPLVPLLTASGFEGLIARGSTPPPCDLQASLLSLPHLAGTRLDTVLAEIPYLTVPEERVASWQSRLAKLGGYRVGIAWQADPSLPHAPSGTVPLESFASLAKVGGVTLVSLEPEGRAELASSGLNVVDLGDDLKSGAWLEMAAVVKSLDLVISPDATVAHLAAALGVPAWIVLSAGTQWRWMHDRSDSPWYPSARLWRQTRWGDWSEVLSCVAAELASRTPSRA